ESKNGKFPPQVIAAAQYFLDHPDAWNQLCGGSKGKMHKEDFLQVASSSMSLTQTELNTVEMIKDHQDTFFGSGVLTRDKLAKMKDDKSLDPKVREAASQLLSDPLLFGLLNNSITGYKTHHKFFDFGGGHTVDSGNISKKDFAHFCTNM
ncbi:MAG: nodulation protein NodX, partial [Mesorhizobium sp.]